MLCYGRFFIWAIPNCVIREPKSYGSGLHYFGLDADELFYVFAGEFIDIL